MPEDEPSTTLTVAETGASNAGGVPPAHCVAISVVVPVGPGDEAWRRLLSDFEALGPADELLLIGVDPAPDDLAERILLAGLACGIQWVRSRAGRAVQMNVGARLARSEQLWFLHCDSRITRDTVAAIRASQAAEPNALHFCDLKFLSDGPLLMRLNEIGVRVRSRWLKMPFGDQAFSLSRALFVELGGFEESVAYGEDHLLVWAARRTGAPVRSAAAAVQTSGRKYVELGWTKATLRNVWRTWRQALPQAWKLLCGGNP